MNFNLMKEFNERIRAAEFFQREGYTLYASGNLNVAEKIRFDYEKKPLSLQEIMGSKYVKQKETLLRVMRNILDNTIDRLGDIPLKLNGKLLTNI